MAARRIIHQDHDISLQNTGCRRIRPLRKLEFWERVVPFVREDSLCQTLLVHGQRVYPQILDPASDIF